MQKKAFLTIFWMAAALAFAHNSYGQDAMTKLADDTFKYIKAGTFGKPKVAKNTQKVSIGQVRVHYKTVSSQYTASKNNDAEVTVYLDSDLTNQDLQDLTDEFYLILLMKFGKAGIAVAPFSDIKATEYYTERQQKQEDKKPSDHGGKNGQAWVSFSAQDGPVLLKWRPYGSTELVGFGQLKDMAKAAKTVGADLVLVDVVLDFAAIGLTTDFKQEREGWLYDNGKYTGEYSIGAMMNVPQSYIWMNDAKNNFDQYMTQLPIGNARGFAEKPYEDASKAALKAKGTFGDARFRFTPLVITTSRERYKMAAIRTFNLYADMLVEKLKYLRGGEQPQNAAENKPKNDPPAQPVNQRDQPETDGELDAAAKDAVKRGDYKLAVEYYSRIINRSSEDNDQEYLIKRSVINMDYLKDYKAALKDCDEGIKQDPGQPVFYYNRATIYLHQKDYKKAKKEFDTYLTMNPNFADGYINRGITNAYLKDVEAAIADFTRAIQLNPRSVLAYRNRAAMHKARGNMPAAQADELRAAQIERGQ